MTSTEKPTRTFESERSTLLDLTPVDEDGMFQPIQVAVDRGTLTTVKTDGTTTKAARFQVSWTKPKADEPCVGMGAKIDGALTACLKAASYGSAQDFTYDTETEFFAAAPKANADDADPFQRDDASELYELRKRLDHAAGDAMAGSENAQKAWLAVSQIAQDVFERLGRDGKAFKRWAAGAEHAGEAPWLASIAKGKNALAELRVMANLTEQEFSVLPVHLTRGGSIDIFLRDAVRGEVAGPMIGAILDEGDLGTTPDGAKPSLTKDQLLAAASAYVEGVLKVSAPYASLAEGMDLARSALQGHVDEYLSVIGKDWSRIDDRKQADAAARQVMGKVRYFSMIQEALDLERALDAAIAAGDKGKLGVLAAKRGETAFMRNIVAATVKAKTDQDNTDAKRKSEARASEVLAKAEPLAAPKKLVDGSAMDYAAAILRSIEKHSSPESVMAYLKDMWAAKVKAAREAKAEVEGD